MGCDDCLVVAMADQWVDDFIGEQSLAELRSIFGRVVRLNPSGVDRAQWQARLVAEKPDAIVTSWQTPPIPAECMPKLKLLAHTTGSVRHLVTRDMIERGLWVTNWGSVAAKSVAECALLLILCSLRQVPRWTLLMHCEKGWPDGPTDAGTGLFGRRVGIHGFGAVARELVKLLKPFECQISAYSQGVPAEIYAQNGVTAASGVEALFSGSEVLVEAEALNAVTRGQVTERLLRLLPAGAAFVNVGRGAVVDEMALGKVAAEGSLRIGLDVYAAEPLAADSPLRGLPNVTLLPHVAGPTNDRRRECGRLAIEALKQFAAGKTPENLITPEIYDRST